MFQRDMRLDPLFKYRECKERRKKPVSLEITFVPPHPFMCNMPEKQFIKAESITNAYEEVVNFFKSYGLECRN